MPIFPEDHADTEDGTSTEVAPMTDTGELPHQRPPDELASQILVGWRVRCAFRRAAWELTAGSAAGEVCTAVARTLEEGAARPELARALRAWGARLRSPAAARAALQCLAETVSAVVFGEYGDFRPRGLDPTLEALARESLVPAGRRTVPVQVDQLTGCPDRGALEADLAAAVPGAAARGGELTVAVLELEDAHVGPHGTPSKVDDVEVLGLLATIRRSFDGHRGVYRVAHGSLAVVAPGVGTVAMGEHILRATCSVGPRFHWGTANLRAVGDQAATSPDLLLLLAESDLVLRRQEMTRAGRAVVRHRRLSAVGSAAAALLLFAAVGVALRGPPSPQPTRSALPVQPAPAPAPASPPTSVPAETPASPATSAPPPAPATVHTVSSPTPAPGTGSAAPSGVAGGSIVLTSYQAPTTQPPTTQTPAPPTTQTPPPPGNSGGTPHPGPAAPHPEATGPPGRSSSPPGQGSTGPPGQTKPGVA